ncbi:DUF3718 domain-containing protein [Ferrimonas pelagia]|uniref:DUF3718 domain-containing protein n=1 Tax=Ferrimonas pelagia TaxID=1177826 RepID=A0ABP9F557_9GAMM
MKRALFASLFLICGTVSATEFVAMNDTRETRLCMAAATGTPLKMHTAVKHSGYAIRNVVRGIACNDEPINFFAARYNSDQRVVDRLNRHARNRANVEIIDLSQRDQPLEISGARH